MNTSFLPHLLRRFNGVLMLQRPLLIVGLLVGGLNATLGNDVDGTSSRLDVLVVVGAKGEDEFGETFDQTAQRWREVCKRAKLNHQQIGPDASEETTNRQRIESTLDSVAKQTSVRPFWVIFIGHGTWDGTTANFNLVGPDVNAKELSGWSREITRPLVIVNGASSSAPFIERLSGPNRVVVTATKSGSEQNFTRFGEYFVGAFNALDADLDHDDSISVREAFLKAVSDTGRFYRERGRLATEHALLDDNNDRKGSSSALILGKAKTKAGGKVDGERASRLTIPATTDPIQFTDAQLIRRDELESQLRDIVKQHANSDDPSELRMAALPVLLELSQVYADATKENATSEKSPDSDQP